MTLPRIIVAEHLEVRTEAFGEISSCHVTRKKPKEVDSPQGCPSELMSRTYFNPSTVGIPSALFVRSAPVTSHWPRSSHLMTLSPRLCRILCRWLQCQHLQQPMPEKRNGSNRDWDAVVSRVLEPMPAESKRLCFRCRRVWRTPWRQCCRCRQ